jgi:cysteine desulfurase / selenocysteine lyase
VGNSIADRLGLITAGRYALSLGIDEIEAEVSARAAMTRSLLGSLPGVQVHDLGEKRCGLVSFSVAGRDPVEVRDLLWSKGVAVTVTHASSTRLDMTRRGLDSMLRASPHYFVSPGQITGFAERLADV